MLRMYTTCCLMVILPYAKIWYAYIKEQRRSCQTKILGEIVIFILRSKVKVILRSRMYSTCCLMVMHPYAKIFKLMTKGNAILPDSSLIFILRSKVKVILRSRMYSRCWLMVMHPCAKIWYAHVQEQRHVARLKSMVKIISY